MKQALLTEMLQKGSESDDSNSQNSFSDVWQVLGPALTALLPILVRLAFARIGGNASGLDAVGSKSADTSAAQSTKPEISPSERAQNQHAPSSVEC